jgi:hypothetical protein
MSELETEPIPKSTTYFILGNINRNIKERGYNAYERLVMNQVLVRSSSLEASQLQCPTIPVESHSTRFALRISLG